MTRAVDHSVLERIPALQIDEVLRIQECLKNKWGIEAPRDSADWARRLDELPEGVAERYWELHEKQAEFIRAGKRIPIGVERSWYDFLATWPIAGIVHSQKAPYILDSAAAVIRIWRHLGLKGGLTDIGCHVGYHLDLYEQFTSAQVVGIEASPIAAATARSMLGERGRVVIEAGDVMTVPIPKSKLISCVDAFPHQPAELALLIRRLADALESDGILVLAGDLLGIPKGELARICQHNGLKVKCHEVIGGWIGALGSFNNRLLIALGRDGSKVPRDVYLNWDGFPQYANSPDTPWDRKCQAFYWAKSPQTESPRVP